MRKIILLVVVFVAFLSSCKEKKQKTMVKKAVEVKASKILNNIDTMASTLNWKGSKPTGSHDGTVKLKSGSILIESGKLKGGSFVIDMNSIYNKDIKDRKTALKLEGHLKSKDFFEVNVYPTSKFEITKVEEVKGKLMVTGNLKIKDVKKSITIPTSVSMKDRITTFKSDVFYIDRSDFNVKYASKKFFDNLKNKFISDIIELSFIVKTKA